MCIRDRDNTIFIFTSDNGTSTRIVSQMADGTLRRGGKGDPRGVGTSVPLIVCWGDRIAPRVSERLADFTDLFPTFADAMRIGIPAEWKLDGVSLYPEIAGQKPLEKEISLMHYNPLWPTAPAPYASRAARTAEYKYYWDGRFYNTKEDFCLLYTSQPAPVFRALYDARDNRLPLISEYTEDKKGTYLLNKWFDNRNDALKGNVVENDFPHLRYADVVLMYAEALAESGSSLGDALVWLLSLIHI